MLRLILHTLLSCLQAHRSLALENLALRQQILILQRANPKPAFTPLDRLFWALLSRLWPGWRRPLRLVKPETVIAWHRQWLSDLLHRRESGRPSSAPMS